MGVEVFASGVRNPEGPVSLIDGSWLVTEMDIAAITKVSFDGKSTSLVANTGLPNGLTIDRYGDIWVADALWRALLRVTKDGEVIEVTKGSEEFPFLLPNDLCFGPDGMIYMTDSGMTLDEFRQVTDPMSLYDMKFDGKLYQINPTTGDCVVIDRGFRLTNGIAFGPGGKELYVAETMTGSIYRYSAQDWQRNLFGIVTLKPPRDFGKIAGPDGIAFDEKGYLYVTVLVQGDITVLDQTGQVFERIPLEGNLPTNVAFDSQGTMKMLVTEASRGELLMIDTPNSGLPLFS